MKSHEQSREFFRYYEKVILLIRDPEGSILAEFNRKHSKGHVGKADESAFQGDEWPQAVEGLLRRWEKTNLLWATEYKGPLKIIFYEELVKDVERTLRETLNFLNYPINETLLECTMERKDGTQKRKKTGRTFDPYTREMRQRIHEKKHQVYEAIRRVRGV